MNGSYSVTFDIISNGGAGTSVFGGPVTFGTFTNAANNSGTGSAVLTQAITAGQSYKVVATVNDRYTRTGGTPGLGFAGDLSVGVPEPATEALAGLGLVLSALAASRRRKASIGR